MLGDVPALPKNLPAAFGIEGAPVWQVQRGEDDELHSNDEAGGQTVAYGQAMGAPPLRAGATRFAASLPSPVFSGAEDFGRQTAAREDLVFSPYVGRTSCR